MPLCSRRFLTALAFACLLPAAALAQSPVSESGAAALKDHLDSRLGKTGAQLDGPIVVEPAGSYYAITLPSLTTAIEDGRRLALGMTAINASPMVRQGQWKTSMALPSPMTLTRPGGAVDSRITLGKQAVAGLYDAKDGQFQTLKATVSPVTIDRPDQGHSYTIGTAKLIYSLDSLTKNRARTSYNADWSGIIASGLNNAWAKMIPAQLALSGTSDSAPLEKGAISPAAGMPKPIGLLMSHLGAANGEAELENFSFSNALYSGSGEATLKADPSAARGFTGTLKGEINDLSRIQSALQKDMVAAPGTQKVEYLKAITLLGVLDQLGDASGKGTKSYDVRFEQNGSIIVNGQDIMQLVK